MGQAKDKQLDFTKYVDSRIKKKLSNTYSIQMKVKKFYLTLEKRCHYHSTTNVKGDSHESAYMEGQRSVILFIKSMLRNDKEKG